MKEGEQPDAQAQAGVQAEEEEAEESDIFLNYK